MSPISTTISASDARYKFYKILEEVASKLKRVTVTRRGQAQAVLMHPDDVAAWDETMDIMADKKLVAQILKSDIERKKGKIVSEKKLLKELGISSKELKQYER